MAGSACSRLAPRSYNEVSRTSLSRSDILLFADFLASLSTPFLV